MEETSQSPSFTQITERTKLDANLSSTQSIHISGTVVGEIESNQKIILTTNGKINGKLTASHLEIAGKVKGDIRATKKLFIQSTAVIDGNIYAQKLSIDEGANITGNIKSGNNVDVLKSDFADDISKKKTVKSNLTDEQHKKRNNSKKSSSRFVAQVLIAVPDQDLNSEIPEGIKEASVNFMKVFGFALDMFDDPSYEPFFQSLSFVKKSHDTPEEVNHDYQKGKAALEEAFLKKQESKNGKPFFDAANKLIDSTSQLNEFVIVLGKIIIVQSTDDNIQNIAVDIIPPGLSAEIKNNRRQLLHANQVYSKVTAE